MKTVLVVGMNGTIGSALYTHFNGEGRKVCGTTRRPESTNANVLYLNLSDPIDQWLFSDKKFDVVYICAGIFKMDLCESDPEGTYQLNVIKTFELIRMLDNAGSHIIYLSTNQVFSGEKPLVGEATPYSPLNEYGRQKVAIETLIKKYCKRWTIIRLAKVISFELPLFKQWLASLNKKLSIEAFYDMVMAPVALPQVIEVLVKLGEEKPIGCFHLSGAEDITYYDFAKRLASSLQHSIMLVKPVSALTNGIKKTFLPSYTTLDCSNTMALCGKMSLEINDILNVCLKNGV